MKLPNLIPTRCTVLAATAIVAVGILSFLPWRLAAQPLSNAPPTVADTPPQPETLEKWLQGKEIVEVWFVGPWMEPLKLRDSLRTPVVSPHFILTPGEGGSTPAPGGGIPALLEVCMTVTPENVRTLLALQAELDPRGYRLDPAQTHVWSYPGDAEARRQARDLIPEILGAAATGITQALPSVTTNRPRSNRLEYYVAGTNMAGSLMITEIEPGMSWKWESSSVVDQQFHLPHLGLMVTARNGPQGSTFPEGTPERDAIRKAIKKAVDPLLKLEPSPIMLQAPP